jgi:hypothetical protein
VSEKPVLKTYLERLQEEVEKKKTPLAEALYLAACHGFHNPERFDPGRPEAQTQKGTIDEEQAVRGGGRDDEQDRGEVRDGDAGSRAGGLEGGGLAGGAPESPQVDGREGVGDTKALVAWMILHGPPGTVDVLKSLQEAALRRSEAMAHPFKVGTRVRHRLSGQEATVVHPLRVRVRLDGVLKGEAFEWVADNLEIIDPRSAAATPPQSSGDLGGDPRKPPPGTFAAPPVAGPEPALSPTSDVVDEAVTALLKYAGTLGESQAWKVADIAGRLRRAAAKGGGGT